MNIVEIIASLFSPFIIIGAVWYLFQDLKKNMNQIHADHREDMKIMDVQMNKMEERMDAQMNKMEERMDAQMNKIEEKMTRMEEKWIALFEKFHILMHQYPIWRC